MKNLTLTEEVVYGLIPVVVSVILSYSQAKVRFLENV